MPRKLCVVGGRAERSQNQGDLDGGGGDERGRGLCGRTFVSQVRYSTRESLYERCKRLCGDNRANR